MRETEDERRRIPGLDRYLLLDPESRGAAHHQRMFAYDVQLDRRVILHSLGSTDDPRVRSSLERSRAWSAVSNAHLVAVHDCVEAHEVSFVAVEYVPGMTLDVWLAEQRPEWSALSRAFAGAVQALGALHGAGLVHGRIGPEAIVIDAAGHGHVVGFDPATAPAPSTRDDDAHALLAVLVRAADSVRSAPHRAIQALTRSARGEGPDRAASAPMLLRRMQAVLVRDAVRKRRVRWIVLGTTVLAGIAGLGYARVEGEDSRVCSGAERAAATVWNAERGAAVRAAFVATAAPGSAEAADRVVVALDQRTGQWITMHTSACEATRMHGVQSEQMLARRMRCLDELREQVDALAQVFEHADREVVARAIAMVEGLSEVSTCDGSGLLGGLDGPDPLVAERVDDLRKQLARLRVLHLAGRHAESTEPAEAIVAQANALGFAPLVAEATVVHGRALAGAGDPLGAWSVFEEAVRAAWLAGHDAVVLAAWVELQRTLGEKLAREAEAEEAWKHALAAWERAGRPERAHADLLAVRAVVLFARGKYRESADLHRRALALRRELLPAEHSDVVSVQHNLANALAAAGESEQALAAYAEVLEVWSRTLGPGHLSLANVHNNIGAVHLGRGENQLARQEFTEALEIRTRVLGPEHLEVAAALENLGVVAYRGGQLSLAMQHFERALAIKRAHLPADAPDTAGPLLNIGTVLHARGEYAQAIDRFEQARQIYIRSLGPDHPHVAIAAHDIGWTLRSAGQPERAIPMLEQALSIRERALGSEHPATLRSRAELGLARLEAGDAAAARPLLERVAAVWGDGSVLTDDTLVEQVRRALVRLDAPRVRSR